MGFAAAALSTQRFISGLATTVGASRSGEKSRISFAPIARRETLRRIVSQSPTREGTTRRKYRPNLRYLHQEIRSQSGYPSIVGGPFQAPRIARTNEFILSAVFES